MVASNRVQTAELFQKFDQDTSHQIFIQVKHLFPSMKLAIDIGAGIGRVTKSVLRYPFEKVDILEQSEELIEKAK